MDFTKQEIAFVASSNALSIVADDEQKYIDAILALSVWAAFIVLGEDGRNRLNTQSWICGYTDEVISARIEASEDV